MRTYGIAEGVAQSGLENLQGPRVQNLSPQPAPLLGCPQGKKVLPNIHQEFPVSIYVLCLLSSCYAPL